MHVQLANIIDFEGKLNYMRRYYSMKAVERKGVYCVYKCALCELLYLDLCLFLVAKHGIPAHSPFSTVVIIRGSTFLPHAAHSCCHGSGSSQGETQDTTRSEPGFQGPHSRLH